MKMRLALSLFRIAYITIVATMFVFILFFLFRGIFPTSAWLDFIFQVAIDLMISCGMLIAMAGTMRANNRMEVIAYLILLVSIIIFFILLHVSSIDQIAETVLVTISLSGVLSWILLKSLAKRREISRRRKENKYQQEFNSRFIARVEKHRPDILKYLFKLQYGGKEYYKIIIPSQKASEETMSISTKDNKLTVCYDPCDVGYHVHFDSSGFEENEEEKRFLECLAYITGIIKEEIVAAVYFDMDGYRMGRDISYKDCGKIYKQSEDISIFLRSWLGTWDRNID